jgi:hypothetical protein
MSGKPARVSASRTYMLGIKGMTYGYKITLPNSYENNELGAVTYYFDRINPNVQVIDCVPFEEYMKQKLAEYSEKSRPSSESIVEIAFHNRELIEKIKISLGLFYGREPDHIENSEVLDILERLENENLRYLSTLTSINRVLKDAMALKNH